MKANIALTGATAQDGAIDWLAEAISMVADGWIPERIEWSYEYIDVPVDATETIPMLRSQGLSIRLRPPEGYA